MVHSDASRQLVGLLFIYLTLSGHALRNEVEAVRAASALNDLYSASGPNEKAVKDFETKVQAFHDDPSMKGGMKWGSGMKLVYFWTRLSTEKKTFVSMGLESSIAAMRDFPPTGVDENGDLKFGGFRIGQQIGPQIKLAWNIQEGVNKWFGNQAKKAKPNPVYTGCVFDVLALGNETSSLTIDNAAEIAPKVLNSECRLGTEFAAELKKKPRWARLLLWALKKTEKKGVSEQSLADISDALANENLENEDVGELASLSELTEKGLLALYGQHDALTETETGFFWFLLLLLLLCSCSSGSRYHHRRHHGYYGQREYYVVEPAQPPAYEATRVNTHPQPVVQGTPVRETAADPRTGNV